MNDAPVRLITISGAFSAPDNRPIAGVTLKLRTRKYTNRLFQNEEITCTTGRNGEYSFTILPGDYEASCVFYPDARGEALGVIHVDPGSPDGTLNDFLGLTTAESYPPAIVVKIIEWVDLAEYYAMQARLAAEDAGVNPRGEYDASMAYEINDLVLYAGSEYRATAAISGVEPPAIPWELFISKGDTGPANTLTIGTVTTLDPDEPATAEITGEAPNQELNLGIPKGEPGGSGSSVPEFGGPGDCGFFKHSNDTTTSNPGDSVPGSSLNYCCINTDLGQYGNEYQGSGTYPAGTWRVGGLTQTTAQAGESITVCIRIDDATLHRTLRHSNNGSQIVRNPVYSAADNSTIDCEVFFRNKWHPFTASLTDCTIWGREIYERARAGEFGNVAEYPAT